MEEEPKEPSQPTTLETNEVDIFPFLLGEPSSSLDIELAAAFMTTEVNREKGGGILKKKPAESIALFSKILWPYWLSLSVYFVI